MSSLYASTPKTYNVFISHAWSYTKGYDRVVELLNEAPRFNWRNYSAPRSDPAVDRSTTVGKKKLVEELKDQIRPAQVVLVIAGMYASYSEWIQAEMDI